MVWYSHGSQRAVCERHSCVPTRHQDDSTRTLPFVNPSSRNEGGTGYLQAPKNMDIKSMREQPAQLPAAYRGGSAAYTLDRYCEPKTNRQDYQQTGVVASSNPHIQAPAPRIGMQHAPTNREDTQKTCISGQ